MNKETAVGIATAEDKRRQRALKVQALALEGFTQAEIGKRVNLSQRGVGLILAGLSGGKAARKAATSAQRQVKGGITAAAVLGAPVAVPVAPEAIRQRALGAGRKPAGDGGERVRDYPAVMLRLPVATLAKLKALAAVRGVPIWRLIDAAVLAFVAAVPGDEAEDVRRLAKREAERLTTKHGKW